MAVTRRGTLDDDDQAIRGQQQGWAQERQSLLRRLEQINNEEARSNQRLSRNGRQREQINQLSANEDAYFERLASQLRQHLPTDQVPHFDEALASGNIDRYLEEVRRSRRANNTPRTWRESSRYTMRM
ncbi:hypothetical protein DM01DRAFT_1380646 [Hesseltinella vesiculosa]|uniref:Uncharacterized protein n=1 Tax=Hesseltinella vesiculosa TaxID=101127 RepID=A0A1X2GRY3_9FUNG|nr:hypothetical protein DM01DRAFT_1380646 [Hesseltinella vesiculosa]